jgi:hypothetical protein
MNFVNTALKAFYGSAVAFLSGLGTVLVGNESIGDVTTAQWVTIATATIVAWGAIYGVTNKPS